jgi:hypothetical protein
MTYTHYSVTITPRSIVGPLPTYNEQHNTSNMLALAHMLIGSLDNSLPQIYCFGLTDQHMPNSSIVAIALDPALDATTFASEMIMAIPKLSETFSRSDNTTTTSLVVVGYTPYEFDANWLRTIQLVITEPLGNLPVPVSAFIVGTDIDLYHIPECTALTTPQEATA